MHQLLLSVLLRSPCALILALTVNVARPDLQTAVRHALQNIYHKLLGLSAHLFQINCPCNGLCQLRS